MASYKGEGFVVYLLITSLLLAVMTLGLINYSLWEKQSQINIRTIDLIEILGEGLIMDPCFNDYGDIKKKVHEIEDRILWINIEKANLERERLKLFKTINKIKPNEPVKVSDHAVVRYLERKYNMDVDDVREEIRSYFITGVDDGIYGPWVVKENTVVTYMPN